MWFLFSCDLEAGSYAQWCVVLINLQLLNFSQLHGGSSTWPVISMWIPAVILGLLCLLRMPLVGVGGTGKASDLITSLETK